MIQLAMRTGVYRTINVTEIHEGELIEYDRVRGYPKFSFITNDAEREKTPVIGYCAYYELLSKWGIMSIDYHTASPEMAKAADAMKDVLQDDNDFIDGEDMVNIDMSTCEIISEGVEA